MKRKMVAKTAALACRKAALLQRLLRRQHCCSAYILKAELDENIWPIEDEGGL